MTPFITEENRESAMDRPSDAEHDRIMKLYGERRRASDNVFAELMQAQAQARAARAEAAPHHFRFMLSNENETVEFRPDADGHTVTIIRKVFIGDGSGMFTLSLSGARREWAEMVSAGFRRW